MGLTKIIYDAGSGPVELAFLRGPQGFQCGYSTRAHDNLATSGIRERVLEGNDILIAFRMDHLAVEEDLPEWAAFMKWALGGGQFDFYPDADLPDYYHCVSDDEGFEPVRTGPGRYGVGFRIRIVPDEQAPADPSVVMKRFYGVGA